MVLATDPVIWRLFPEAGTGTVERATRVSTSPVDDRVLGRVEQATPEDVDRAVMCAQTAYANTRSTPKHQRAAWLREAADLFDAAVERFVETLVLEVGKPRKQALNEARRGSDLLRLCAAELGSMVGDTLPLDAVAGGENRTGMTVREPLGVVAAITPFNAPINLMMQKLAPALAMGNAVVVKPAPETAITTLQVVRAIAPAFPADLISVVCGDVAVGQRLVSHPRVAAVSLTGGVAAGQAVMAAAGIKPVLLELGSNAANLVLADADLDDAATRISVGAFGASGQQCISVQRVIVHADVVDSFAAKFAEAAAALVVGDPQDPTTDLGPMIHDRARDHAVALVDDAETRGARVLLDGRRDGRFLAPTVIRDPDQDARILVEEVFGPVAVIITARDTEHAIEIANSVDLGLQGACFTDSLDEALRVANGLRVGSVWINESSRFRLDNYPFGGVGRSGIGREGVRWAMEELSSLKFIGIRHRH
jgi:acyl-CoA reductase-like NAD-dependent aldehyde dehydrogenase